MDKAAEDARVFGATEESIAAAHGPAEKEFHVWPENWAAVQAFLAVRTQWVTGMNGPQALDYTRVRDGLAMAGIDATPELFQKLRVIEFAVLEALNAKAKTSARA